MVDLSVSDQTPGAFPGRLPALDPTWSKRLATLTQWILGG